MAVRRIIDEQIERVGELLLARRSVLMQAARVLTARETISGDELRALVAAAAAEEADHDSENAAARSLSQLGV